jgi:hypothetical protein
MRARLRRGWGRFTAIDWAKWGTLIAAVAAAAGLIFTGISTFYGVKVSQAQLDQAKEESSDKEREQASRVAIWTEGAKNSNNLVLANRSLDPVRVPTLLFLADFETGTDSWGNAYDIFMGGIPPCSKYTITPKLVNLEDGSGRKLPNDAVFTALFVAFTDSAGNSWIRLQSGKLAPRTDLRGVENAYALIKERKYKLRKGEDQQDLMMMPPEPLEDCSPDSK